MENAHVVLKFQAGERTTENPVISQTMGRIAFIDHGYVGPMPQPKTFWLCKIMKEINKGTGRGCFIVTPIHEVLIDDIVKLVPGTFEIEIQDLTVVCRPKFPERYWIAPFNIKRRFIKPGFGEKLYSSFIVPIQV